MAQTSRVIVALDGMTRDAALAFARDLSGVVWGFKVNDLLLDCGVDIIRELRAFGRVFADPKLYDIPNTVSNAVKKITDSGAELVTVHASGGPGMLQAAVTAAGAAKILAVTILTSFDAPTIRQVYSDELEDVVLRFAKMSASAGVSGIVCSPQELQRIRADSKTKSLLTVIPGIRPSWYGKGDDQVRTLGPKEACDAGADLLVIGRPITGSPKPREAAERINAEIGG